MFLCYGDESLDEKKERVCAVAGLVGLEDAWATLEAKWRDLHEEVPFHANDCESDFGDYEPKFGEDVDANHLRNQDLYRQSTILLAESNIGGYAAAYDLAAQRQAFPPPYMPPVYYQPFLDVIEAMRNFADSQDSHIKFIFDRRAESEHNAGLIYAHIRESHPAWRERIADEISFVDSRNNIRVQIADLFAREVMKMLDNQVGPVKRPYRQSWRALESTGKFRVVVRSNEYFADSKQQIKDIDSITDMSDSGYAAWLQATGRVGNVTNYFEYMMGKLRALSEEARNALGEKLN